LVKTGGRLVKHARYYWLMLAESHLTRRLFGAMVAKDRRLAGADGVDGGRFVAKSRAKEARDGGVRMELTRKMGLVGIDVSRPGDNCALQGRKRLPEEKPQLAEVMGGG
jgi:hypothetical protein